MIALTHMDLKRDILLAKKVPGIDIVLGGIKIFKVLTQNIKFLIRKILNRT